MSTAAQVELLRVRATCLRAVSNAIGASRALVVHTLAGPDTWVGPTPQSCYDALLAIRRHLQTHQQTLIGTARAFERRADELAQQTPVPNIVS
jgi:hypothetical protein